MSDADPTTPTWAPYADGIVRRLHLTLPAADRLSSRDTFLTSPEEAPPDPLPSDPLQEIVTGMEDQDAALTLDWIDGADWGGFKPSGPRRPSVLQLQFTLRLAATLASEATPRSWLQRGVTTMISGMANADTKLLKTLLWLGFLPPGCDIVSKPGCYGANVSDLLLLRPDADGDEVNRFVLKGFHEQIAEALTLPLPVLILCPDEVALPQSLAPYLPQPLRLAPVDRSIMLQQLRLSYPNARSDRETLLAALPSDASLARLPTTGLHVAFRAPDALTAARRMAEFEQTPAAVHAGPRLEDIAGNSEALMAARQLVRDLNLWQRGDLPWSDLCRSLLLHGGPGTGKSHLARATGNSAGISFVQSSFALWQGKGHLGDMLAAMQSTFAEARKKAPSILFIDEIDAVGSREDPDRHGSNYRVQVINGFLEQMDAISREPGVIVIGACNHPDRIDPAVLRAGRFDLKVEVPLPCAETLYGVDFRSEVSRVGA